MGHVKSRKRISLALKTYILTTDALGHKTSTRDEQLCHRAKIQAVPKKYFLCSLNALHVAQYVVRINKFRLSLERKIHNLGVAIEEYARRRKTNPPMSFV